MYTKINILLIEDNPVEAAMLRAIISKAGQQTAAVYNYDVTWANSLEKGLEHLANALFDVILLDLSLPDSEGLETLERLLAQEQNVPVVVLTGISDEALAETAMQTGAQDYLVKGKADSQLLTRAIRYSIERHRLMRNLILVDELTGLYNRRGFLALTEQQLKVARRTNSNCLLAYIDLDGLKQINDTLGHEAGSQAIADTAQILRQTFRESDIIGRLGGDEFTVLLTDTDKNQGSAVVCRLQIALDQNNERADRPFKLYLSVGIASFDWQQPVSLDELMRQADQAMYEQKRRRKQKLPQSSMPTSLIVEAPESMWDIPRQHERTSTSLDVVLDASSGKLDARISDISVDGCFIDCIARVTVGETLRFKARLPLGHWIQLYGEVIHFIEGFGFGLRFTKLAEEDLILIEQVILSHEGKIAPRPAPDTSLPSSEDIPPRVLIADDDPAICFLATRVAQSEGFAAANAKDGQEAFNLLRSGGPFDIVIFDMVMPHMDGMELVRFMRQDARLQHIPVGIMTAEQDPKLWNDSISAGAGIFLPKPFTSEQMRYMLRVMMSQRNSLTESAAR